VFSKVKKDLNKAFTYALNRFASNKIISLLSKKTNKGAVLTFHRVLSSPEQSSEFNSYIEISADKLEQISIDLKILKEKFVTIQ
jgi:hypothetical protein